MERYTQRLALGNIDPLNLLGNGDANLRAIERRLPVSIVLRDSHVEHRNIGCACNAYHFIQQGGFSDSFRPGDHDCRESMIGSSGAQRGNRRADQFLFLFPSDKAWPGKPVKRGGRRSPITLELSCGVRRR